MAPGQLKELEEAQERSIGIELVQEYAERLVAKHRFLPLPVRNEDVVSLHKLQDCEKARAAVRYSGTLCMHYWLSSVLTCSMSESLSMSSLSHSKACRTKRLSSFQPVL